MMAAQRERNRIADENARRMNQIAADNRRIADESRKRSNQIAEAGRRNRKAQVEGALWTPKKSRNAQSEVGSAPLRAGGSHKFAGFLLIVMLLAGAFFALRVFGLF